MRVASELWIKLKKGFPLKIVFSLAVYSFAHRQAHVGTKPLSHRCRGSEIRLNLKAIECVIHILIDIRAFDVNIIEKKIIDFRDAN